MVDQLKVGQNECEMATFNEKNRWVFPLVPTACAYAKLNEYFGKLQNSKIEVSQTQGDFLGKFICSHGFTGEKRNGYKVKWGIKNGDFRNARYGPKHTLASGKYNFHAVWGWK